MSKILNDAKNYIEQTLLTRKTRGMVFLYGGTVLVTYEMEDK